MKKLFICFVLLFLITNVWGKDMSKVFMKYELYTLGKKLNYVATIKKNTLFIEYEKDGVNGDFCLLSENIERKIIESFENIKIDEIEMEYDDYQNQLSIQIQNNAYFFFFTNIDCIKTEYNYDSKLNFIFEINRKIIETINTD